MAETRKLAAILAADVAGYSRLTAADEERTVARLRGLRTDLIDPAISVHHGRVVKRMGDGILIEFRSVVDAVRCAIEVQNGMVERNAGLPPERRILFRVGIHLGDVIEEEDGDLMGDGVNIAARLEGIAEPGAICLSEQAYWQVKSRLDLAVSDLGAKDLKNIPEPVHVFSLEVGKPAQAKPTAPVVVPPPRRRSALVPLLAGLAALIVIVAAAWYFLARPGTNLAANAPAHLSIVVLPFQNLSGDPKQDYFADGITDNLTTDLSRIRNSFVIARNTAFTYKGKNVDAKEIGKELGVRYVLEGSVQRGGNRVRVNAQLIDAESGSHLWADRFEEDLADLFKLQDAIVARLARSLEIELASAESRHARPQNPDAIDVTMQGWAIMYRPPSKENDNAARALFERALTLDAEDDDALSGIAYANGRDYVYGWGDKSVNYDEKIIVPADRAIVLNPSNAMAFYIKSIHLSNTGRLDGAFAVADAGLNRNSNFAPLYVARAIAGLAQGRYDRARSDVLLALRLSPRDAQIGIWYSVLANLEMQLGHGGAAIDAARKAIEEGNLTWLPYAELASAYMSAGNAEEAHAALAEARRLNPKLSLAWVMSHSPRVPAFFDNLRKAGLPEDEPPKHLSIVVLPFTNLSGDPKQDYFADGITDNLTTDLSRVHNSFVIARNTAFTYKGKNVDAKEIGKELGVRYVLEGSVQRDGNRVRVNAQLIDAESGAHLWANRFEEDLADLFKLQDDVVARLANALGYELTIAEAAKGAHSTNPDAIDLTMRGWALLNSSGRNEAANDAARDFFERSLRLDPQNSDALAGEALTYARDYSYGWAKPEIDYDSKILAQADRAIALDPDNVRAYEAKSTYLFLSNRPGEALNVADAGLAINPNFAPLHFARAGANLGLGRFEQAKAAITEAIRLSPRDPQLGLWYVPLGQAEMGLGHYEAAIEDAHKSINAGFVTYIPYADLAAAFALEGKMEEAKSALAEARRLTPQLTIKWLMAHSPHTPNSLEGLRKAGLPEDATPPPPKHLSIVVLPFENLSGDPKQDYFADGITDNLTTDLSRIHDSFVIARNTAFTYKGKNVDAKQIGTELGVRYVLEGSVQRDGNRVRVNAQLIDAETGAELWADRFEEDLSDLFKLQDDVVARLARSTQIELVDAESQRGLHDRSQNPNAVDLTMQGWAILYGPPDKASFFKARPLLEEALKLDPRNAVALAGLSEIDRSDYIFNWSGANSGSYDRAMDEAVRANTIDPNLAYPYYVKSSLILYRLMPNDTVTGNEAFAAAQSALQMDPSFAPALYAMSAVKENQGDFEEEKKDLEQAIRMSPRDPGIGRWYMAMGRQQFAVHRYGSAVEWAAKALDVGYRTASPYLVLAAADAELQRDADARQAMAQARKLIPALSVKWCRAHIPSFFLQPPGFDDALRKAGLPEQ